MADIDLVRLGLSESEARIYKSLLRLGKGTVKEIAKQCGFHRTNIYDVLEQLKEKGLVNSTNEGKVAIYRAADPENLYDFLREKKELLDSFFPLLQQMRSKSSDLVQVEVYNGPEGMKTAFRDMLRKKLPLYAFGVKGQLRTHLPVFAQQWIRDAVRQKTEFYGIYTSRENPPPFGEVRYVSKELDSPVATFVYGDSININIWEPNLVAVIIRSSLVAQSYKQHFNLLWKLAKP